MSTRMALPPDLIELLAVFAEEKVDYLLIGGQALALHGHPRFTKDADLWLRDDAENLRRAQVALNDFGAPEGVVRGLVDAQPLDVLWMGRPPVRIDLMKGVPGGNFSEAWSRRETLVLGAVVCQLVSRRDLIALKRASGRAQDLLDADLLEKYHP